MWCGGVLRDSSVMWIVKREAQCGVVECLRECSVMRIVKREAQCGVVEC